MTLGMAGKFIIIPLLTLDVITDFIGIPLVNIFLSF